MKTQIFIIAFHTLRWTKNLINQFQAHFSQQKLLVIDNNPTCPIKNRDNPKFYEDCYAESKWLTSQSNITLIRPNEANTYVEGKLLPHHARQHGFGMDVAKGWCLQNNIESMCQIEPDCYIFGRDWFKKLKHKLVSEDLWMTGQHSIKGGGTWVCPCIWLLEPIKHLQFVYSKKTTKEKLHPLYHELVNDEIYSGGKWFTNNWDTGQKIWFYCRIREKDGLTGWLKDFKHDWNGSSKNKFPAIPLL